MLKHMLKPVLLSMGLGLVLSACTEFEGVDYLNAGHPADSDAQSGKRMSMSRVLVPENINVRPDLEAVGSGTPSRPAPTGNSGMNHRGSH